MAVDPLRQGAILTGALVVVGGVFWLLARLATVRHQRPLPRTLIFWLLCQGYLVYGLWWIGGLVAPSIGLAILTLLALAATAGVAGFTHQRSAARTWGAAVGWGVPWILAWVVALHTGG